MYKNIGKHTGLVLSLAIPLTMGFSQTSFAQEEEMIEEVVTTGTRSRARSVEDSPAPVDILSAEYFTDQGDTDLSNLVRNIVPSYNVNTQPISDAATIVRPANLRGLAPDHTLVLRRHMDADDPLLPWLIPADRAPASLRKQCGDAPEPFALPNVAGVPPHRFASHIRLAIEPDAMQWAWSAATRDSAFDGAELRIEILPWTLRCADCGRTFIGDDMFAPCACGSEKTSPDGGDELLVVSLEVEEPIVEPV